MKLSLILLILVLANAIEKKPDGNSERITYQAKDKEIAEKILKCFSAEKNIATGELMLKIGFFLKETPYVAHTIEMSPERLVINLRELDCTTFAENCLALARTVKGKKPTFQKFTDELKWIRYHKGNIDGYTSRIHYFSDWIFENSNKGLVKDVTREIEENFYPLNINFMSTHPGSYMALKDNPAFLPAIIKNEKEISKRIMYFIPEDKIPIVENKLLDGDICGITTNIKGIDIQHVVLIAKVDGRVHILHASQSEGKVLLSAETLEEYLKKNKSATGIMVARPL
jgi:hypothetical protein